MSVFSYPKLSIPRALFAIAVVVSVLTAMSTIRGSIPQAHATTAMHIDCSRGRLICSEVYDSKAVFGKDVYIGHDEPSTLFYSNVAGSGNRMQYQLTLPKDPSPSAPLTPGKTFNFQLHPAFWFGM